MSLRSNIIGAGRREVLRLARERDVDQLSDLYELTASVLHIFSANEAAGVYLRSINGASRDALVRSIAKHVREEVRNGSV